MADRKVAEVTKSSKALRKLLNEGYLEPAQEFGLRVDTLASMADTAMSIAADMHSYSESYDRDLGAYKETIETIQDLLDTLAEQICAISEDLDETFGEGSEDEEDTEE
jgi:hypothetical protein